MVKPQVSIIWTAAANIGVRDDKAAEFSDGIPVIAIKNSGADSQLQVLVHIADSKELNVFWQRIRIGLWLAIGAR